MGEVVNLQSKRNAESQRLFDVHRQALAELVCAFAMHSVGGGEDFDATLSRLEAAEHDFVRAFAAMEATGE